MTTMLLGHTERRITMILLAIGMQLITD